LDPRFALAHAMLGLVLVMKYFFTGDASHLREAEACGRRAVALASGDAWCQTAVGHALVFQGRLDEAGPYFERAAAYNPNDTWLGMIRAMWLNYAGRSDEALSTMTEIFRRDPIPLDWYWDALAIVQTAAGRYADAIASYKQLLAVPSWAFAYRAICHVGLGQLDEARTAAAKFADSNPQSTIATFLAMEPYSDPAVIARFRAALAAAGLPEGA
jgi:tetratricopeptide (TPR) repeat protein